MLSARSHIVHIFLVLALLLQAAPCGAWPREVEKRLKELDELLEQKGSFDTRKEDVLDALRSAYASARTDEERYSRASDLRAAYASYQYDSTYAYAQRMHDIASRTGDADHIAEAVCARVDCLVSAGLYKEAFDAASGISPEGLSPSTLSDYYRVMIRLYYSAANYNQTEPWFSMYHNEGARLSNLLLAQESEDTPLWTQYKANLLMESGDFEESISLFSALLSDPSLDLHQKAIITSSMGWMQSCLGLEEDALLSVIESAECDLRSSTKETTALRMLAESLSKKGETTRPVKYIRHSLEDANFYGTRLRKLEVGAVLPLVERNYADNLSRERNLLALVLTLALILAVAAIAAFWFIRRQNRKLSEARTTIEERNSELEAANARLAEVNAIKDEYIGNSFYVNSEYIDRLSGFQKTVDRMVSTGNYELLRRSLKESTIAKERDRMYEAFDATFLKIFPTFIEDYNALFEEKDRQVPSGGLNTEMRIFALIRLGISSSERIARFLDYSVHTINTYKTRVKNRSVVDNDRFEAEILGIGLR